MAKLNESPEPVASPVNDSLGTTAAPGLNVPARLERLPLTRYQRGLFVIIATAWLFDSIDLAALTFILAPMSAEFSLTDTQAGLLASVSFIGMVVGASSAGALADRYGRRPVFATSMLVWGAASLLAALSWDLTSLLVARFLAAWLHLLRGPLAAYRAHPWLACLVRTDGGALPLCLLPAPRGAGVA
jgi:MFS family permease